MSEILIENYRGFDIKFNTSNEKFECICNSDITKESKSFNSVKKFVDDYCKTNNEFKAFFIEKLPSHYYDYEKIKVIGIRKDGKFIAEKNNGEKIIISDYILRDYIISKDENKDAIEKLKMLSEERKRKDREIDKLRKEIISVINTITLDEYKKTLL